MPSGLYLLLLDLSDMVHAVTPSSARIRSLLFCPANDERKLTKALDAGATLAVADLEDAIAPSEKERARKDLRRVVGEDPRTPNGLAIRVNDLAGPDAAADLELVRELGPAAVVVPKAAAATLAAAAPGLPPIVAIVETPAGLQECAAIARVSGVKALLLGGVDLALALRLGGRADGLDLLFARSRLVVDSAAAGIDPPLDGVFTAVGDLDGLRAEAELVRSLGFGGKACIHPAHLETIHEAFSPGEAEATWARRVVEAFDGAAAEGSGAISVDGEMVDLPVAERARAILAELAETTVGGAR